MLFLLLLFPLIATAAEPVADLLRTWQGIPGIERTAKGRVYVSWFSGGPREPAVENTVYLAYSDDQGKTFTKPVPMAGPRERSRAFDPTLWRDPSGTLWYIFNRGNRETAEHGVWARTCRNPDARVPQWSEEFRVGFDEAPFAFRMNKPVVLSGGEWVMPVTHAPDRTQEWFAFGKQVQGAAVSAEKGRTWKLYGSLQAPAWALENMIVERKDKSLWMLIRTGGGALWESTSTDRGRTWSAARSSGIPSPGSRFFLRRLASGNLLLVNHQTNKSRSHLTARVSKDDGKSWSDGLLLDERMGVSYPDAIESNGVISVVYDRDRLGDGEILLAAFTERDAMAGRDVSGKVRLRQTISRLEKPVRYAEESRLLPPDWDAKRAGDAVLKSLVPVTGPGVKGAHDAELAFEGDRAYIVAEVNEQQAGENAAWPFVTVSMSIVNVGTIQVEKVIPVAHGGQAFANETLPEGACFVPRILRLDARTMRVFFASEAPGKRQAQTYYLDFDLASGTFEKNIHRAKIRTAAGTFDMQPRYLYEDAAAQGFQAPPKDFGLYIFDSFKVLDGKTYVALNNYPGGQNALAVLGEDRATFEVIGHYNQAGGRKLTESAVNRLPDGTWLAICRQEGGDRNYLFSTSADGRTWSEAEARPFVPNGTNSKPVFEKFYGVYYLGWQESTQVNGALRSVFNVDVSADGVHWERKYRFETDKSFQYPAIRAHRYGIYVAVTQGDTSPSRKERVMFGRFE